MKTRNNIFVLFIIICITIIYFGCTDAVNTGKNITRAEIYPNPTLGNANLNVFFKNIMPVTINIVDTYGREVMNIVSNQDINATNYIFPLRMNNLPSGNYCCIINCGGEITIVRFTIYK